MRFCAICLLSAAALGARAEEVRFVDGPTVTKARDRFEVRFSVSRATDVEVAILDDRGAVVRHLGAGVLGGQSDPPPPADLPYERVAVAGAEWTFFGISPVPAANNWGHRGCVCQKIGFDVDGFGRVFAPDVLRCRVHVLDGRGNRIASFGRYGNADSAGPGSAVPVPGIPLAWAPYLAVAGRDVYLSDKLNRRVVHVRLGYAAEATRPL